MEAMDMVVGMVVDMGNLAMVVDMVEATAMAMAEGMGLDMVGVMDPDMVEVLDMDTAVAPDTVVGMAEATVVGMVEDMAVVVGMGEVGATEVDMAVAAIPGVEGTMVDGIKKH